MATLNRFPLWGLWNRVAAEVLEYEADEARCIGHAVAVLYAIRAQGGGYRGGKSSTKKGSIPAGAATKVLTTDELAFGGDSLPCEMDEDGRVVKCLVGCKSPKDKAQTPSTYERDVEGKVPLELRQELTEAMQALLSTYSKMELSGRLIYRIYDQWKKECKAGRRVDLNNLLDWLRERAEDRKKAA